MKTHVALAIVMIFAIITETSAQGTKVTLLQPINGATGVIDPIDGNINGDMRWVFKWEALEGANGYELNFKAIQNSNWDKIEDVNGGITSLIFGPDGVWCCFGRNETYVWRVRALVNDTLTQWSDEWIFTTADWVVPNDKDQQMLDQIGWMKPTVWDSTKFYYTTDIAEDLLELHKESYKAQGDLIGHIGSKIYIFGADETLWGPVLDQNYADCMASGSYCERSPHWMGINRGHNPNEIGTPNKGIGHRWVWSSVDETREQGAEFFGPSVVQDTHEWTHNFEASRTFSGGNYARGTPLWYIHMTSGPFGYAFDRDYGFPLNAKYESNFYRDVTDSTGNGYRTYKPAEPDHTRHALGWVFNDFRNDPTAVRDSMLRADQRYTPIAGHYLAYLTSPQEVFIDKYDDRAWTKPFEQQFEDAFGMTILEFSRKFYDWMLTVDQNNWTYILPKEHSTELFHYPKRFDTTEPAMGAQAIGRRPEFRWKPSTDFSSYQIQISTTEDFADPVHTMDVEGATSVYQDEVTTATLDTVLEANTTYFWRMRSILGVNQSDWTTPGRFTTGTRVAIEQDALPFSFSLAQNYPNPFNPRTTIVFTIPEAQRVRLDIYNLLGQRVATLIDKQMNSGQHSIGFHAADLSSGMYLYRLTGSVSGEQTRTMYLIK